MLSPLRHIPGPIPAKLTKFWLLAIELCGRRALYVHALHQRYGPVVRVGPNELSFASAAAVRDIYVGVNTSSASAAAPSATTRSVTDGAAAGAQANSNQEAATSAAAATTTTTTTTTTTLKTFPKGPLYDIGRPNIGSIRDEAAHRERLRRVGHCFSVALLPGMEPAIHEQLERLLGALEARRGEAADIFYWFRMFALDVAGHLFLGKSSGALTSLTQPKVARYLDVFIHAWLLQDTAPRLFRLLKSVPSKWLQEFLESADGIYEYGEAAFHEFIARNGRNSASRLPLARLLAGNVAKGEPPLPDADLAMETLVMLVAATDTTGTALTYLFFELARHREWYTRLRDEVCAAAVAAGSASSTSASGSGKADASHVDASDDSGTQEQAGASERKPLHGRQQKLSYAALQGLPILNAVVWETLRMYPSVPTALQRQVPRGGAPVTGAGTWLPEGTIVAVPVYTVQRNADAFPQPDEWQPERWLTYVPSSLSSSETTAAAVAASHPQKPAADAANVPYVDRAAEEEHAISTGLSGSASGGRDALKTGEAGEAATSQGRYVIHEDAAMRAHMLVFSRGVRACLGKSIALAELKLATALLAQRFAAVRLADERQTVRDMRVTDRFVLVPRGKRCELVFE